jgi:hypothetical protein
MNKKPIVFLVLAFFVFSVFAIAANAEDQANDNSQDQDTEHVISEQLTMLQEQEQLASDEDMNESEITHNPLGAKVRLLQLEKQVIRSYMYGEAVISQIENKSFNVSTEGLQDTIDSLKDLDADIKDLLEQNLTSDSVGTYVELKHRAINLTKEFRGLLASELTAAQRKEIKDALGKKALMLDDINEQIRKAVKEFNKQRTLFMLEKLGLNKTELLDRVESGNITAKELKEEIKDAFKSLGKEEKKGFQKKIEDEKVKILEQRQKAFVKGLENAKEQMGKAKEHMEKAMDLLNNTNFTYMEKKAKLGAMIKGEIDEKVKNFTAMHNSTFNETKNRIQERIQDLKEIREDRMENRTDRIEKKIENRMENRQEGMRGGKE